MGVSKDGLQERAFYLRFDGLTLLVNMASDIFVLNLLVAILTLMRRWMAMAARR